MAVTKATKRRKVVTQKSPYYPKPNKEKWEKEIKTKKDRQEYKEYYGHNPGSSNGG